MLVSVTPTQAIIVVIIIIMGNVVVVNKSNIILNTALCVVIRYYEANKVLPGHNGTWTGVGYVWFSVVQVPWYGPRSEFGDCQSVYHDYIQRIPEMAANVSKTGEASLGYVTIKGHNVTQIQAEERLRNLAYWGDGFKVAGNQLTFTGGPSACAVQIDPHVIDISQHFDNIRFSMTSLAKTMALPDADDLEAEDSPADVVPVTSNSVDGIEVED